MRHINHRQSLTPTLGAGRGKGKKQVKRGRWVHGKNKKRTKSDLPLNPAYAPVIDFQLEHEEALRSLVLPPSPKKRK